MDVGGGFLGGEAWCGVGWLLKDPEATTHGTPDDGVMVEFDGDVPCLRDLPLMPHMDGDEVWGYVDPKALGAFVCRVAVWRGLLQRDGTGYSPSCLFVRFDDRRLSSPPSVAPSPLSSSNLRKRGVCFPFFSIDR